MPYPVKSGNSLFQSFAVFHRLVKHAIRMKLVFLRQLHLTRRQRARAHVPRSITSSDTRRGSSSRSMRFHSTHRSQFAVSEPTGEVRSSKCEF